MSGAILVQRVVVRIGDATIETVGKIPLSDLKIHLSDLPRDGAMLHPMNYVLTSYFTGGGAFGKMEMNDRSSRKSDPVWPCSAIATNSQETPQ